MAVLTNAQLKDELSGFLGDPGNARWGSDARQLAINTAIDYIASRFKFLQLEEEKDFSTVIGQSDYNIQIAATDGAIQTDNQYRKTIDLWRPTDEVKLRKVTRSQYNSLRTLLTGDPLYYFRFGNVLRVTPTPNRVITLRHTYIRPPAAMTADGDIPEIPSGLHHVISWFSSAKLKGFELEYDELQTLLNNAENLLLRSAASIGLEEEGAEVDGAESVEDNFGGGLGLTQFV